MITIKIATVFTLTCVMTVSHAAQARHDDSVAQSAESSPAEDVGQSLAVAGSGIDAKKIADEFAATVKGVVPTQINTNQAGNNANLELWRKGTQDLLSYQNWGKNTYIRNVSNVLKKAGVDLSGISVPSWINSLNQQQLYATAISPLHIIAAAHWHPAIGQAIFFVDAANHPISRQIVSAQQIIDPKGGLTDLWVASLSEALPESIKPFKVLPAQDRSFVDDIPIPAWIAQGGLGTVSVLWTATGANDAAAYQPPSKGFDVSFSRHDGAYAGWNSTVHGGSGSPIFVVIDHQPVLVSILHYMSGTSFFGGPSVADLSEQINKAMAKLQGGSSNYRLTVFAEKP